MVFFQLAATLSLPQAQPVGSAIRATGKPFLIDKGFQKHRPVSVALLPVLRQLPSRLLNGNDG